MNLAVDVWPEKTSMTDGRLSERVAENMNKLLPVGERITAKWVTQNHFAIAAEGMSRRDPEGRGNRQRAPTLLS